MKAIFDVPDFGLIGLTVSALVSDGSPEKGEEEEGEEDQVTPPDNRVAQQIDPLVIAGEKLSL